MLYVVHVWRQAPDWPRCPNDDLNPCLANTPASPKETTIGPFPSSEVEVVNAIRGSRMGKRGDWDATRCFVSRGLLDPRTWGLTSATVDPLPSSDVEVVNAIRGSRIATEPPVSEPERRCGA